MTSPPDKLFRDRLENYNKQAPPSAWNRIESGLDHKRTHRTWMKIAAGLLLLIAASTLIWRGDEKISVAEKPGDIKEEITGQLENNRKGVYPEKDVKPEVLKRDAEITLSQAASNFSQSSSTAKKKRIKGATPINPASLPNHPDIATTASTPASEELPENPVDITEGGTELQVISGEIKEDAIGTNITYTAKEVNAKFLKQVTPSDATPEKKTTSGFQKVIDRAFELTHEESLLAELREKKNEWLSINISSKQRETNK
jgi:hypothetical protein